MQSSTIPGSIDEGDRGIKFEINNIGDIPPSPPTQGINLFISLKGIDSKQFNTSELDDH
jgi:hypothetical protein